LDEFIDIALNQYGFQVLPIQPSHAAKVAILPFHHKDPFDRLLIAQALTEGIAILSSGTALDTYGVARMW
jgi:PIN domain nuclease of toxin-antitoxin system